MHIGIPKEIKPDEYRVAATPAAIGEYVSHDHRVTVETGAGIGINASDEDYRAAGASIAPSAAAVFDTAELIIKVKEPQPQEWARLRADHILFTYLHLAADPAQARGLVDSGATAIAYETVEENGKLPLLTPMSEVAGRLSIQAAAGALERHRGGRGVLMGGVPGVPPANVLVIGGGVVGEQAARMAVGLGAAVTLADRSIERLRELDRLFHGAVETVYASRGTLSDLLPHADVVVGAVLVVGAAAPKVITRQMLARMRHGAVIIDVAIDQGGCVETSHPTTHANPTFEVDGIVHYCVANMPGAVPLTSSIALSNATLPYGLAIADLGLTGALHDPRLLAGLNVHRGMVTNKAVAESLGLAYRDPRTLLG